MSALSLLQSQRSEGATPHISYCKIWTNESYGTKNGREDGKWEGEERKDEGETRWRGWKGGENRMSLGTALWSSCQCTYPFADWWSHVGLVWPITFGQLTGRCEGTKVDGLKNFLVEVLCLRALKRVSHQDESISQTLNPNANGSVTFVGIFSLRTKEREKNLFKFNQLFLSLERMLEGRLEQW